MLLNPLCAFTAEKLFDCVNKGASQLCFIKCVNDI